MKCVAALLAVAVIAGCGPQQPLVIPSASPSATASAIRVPFPITPALFVNDDPVEIRTGGRYLTDGDIDLTFRIDFHADMDATSVANVIRAGTPEARSIRWPADARSVQFDVPAGTSTFVIDASGAVSANGNGTVVPSSWTVARPASTLAFYDPASVARGDTAPSRSIALQLNASGPVHVAHDGRTALVYHSPGHRTAVSVVDLPTGRRIPLPAEIVKIASNGARFQWLPDGRLLTLGSHDTIVSSATGTGMRWLPALVGQGGPVSPGGDRIAVWSYAHNTVAVVDLGTGLLTSFGEGFLRCSVGGGVSLAWSPDGRRLAVGHCTEDMAGSSRTTYLDAATGRAILTTPDVSVLAWLKDGSQLLARWSSGASEPRRFPEPGLTLLRPDGSARTITSASPWSISPDGLWLLDAGDSPRITLIRLRDGATYDVPNEGSYVTWTPEGKLLVAQPPAP
jgi:hypothetical protein